MGTARLATPLARGGGTCPAGSGGPIGTAGIASAQEGLDANFGKGQFVVNQNGAGVADTNSTVNSDGLQHTDFWIWSDDTGVSGAFTGSGATWNQG
ncbi:MULTISPECIES: hypothetical protein [unclassified Kitasatospora]|uniref:hypothetical protein n=1 Tax=unclassified Kitasatospora TaxID=2633591 RepID=UPI0036978B33